MFDDKAKYFLYGIIILGVTTCCLAIYYLPFAKFDLGLIFLSASTILFASRLSIQFPKSKVHFLMGDGLIFLTFLLYGGETAIVLAGAEAFCTSLRLKNRGVFTKFSTVLQNTGIMACSTAGTYAGVLLYSYCSQKTPDYDNPAEFFSLLGLLALVQFSTNSFITALGETLKTGNNNFWKTLVEKCLGSSVLFIAGAAFAGLAFKLIENISGFAVIIAVAIVGLLYLTYHHYIAEIKLRQEQAEQAERERVEAESRRVEDAERYVEELRQSQQMLQLVMDNIPQYVFWKNRDLVYIGCNRNFAQAAGLNSPLDIIGKTDYALPLKKEDADLFRQLDERILKSGQPEYLIRQSIDWADGKKSWVDTNKVPLRNLQGEIIGILGTFEDVTYRVQIEDEQQRLKDQLLQSQKMEAIGTLAGGIAHDFNNLLTVILGNTEIAFDQIQPAHPVGLRLTEIEKAAHRAAVLTRQLLAFSRRQQIERSIINVNHTIAEIMKLLDRIIGVDVKVKVTAGSQLSAVFADPAQIEQVIMNLVINARDAMPKGGQLNIETSNIILDENYVRLYPYARPGNYVQIMVSDTGSGMDEETKMRLFEPFFTTKEVGKGTGLGLSMAYGIIKQHEGHINVYSELGHGTTFKVFLPVVELLIEEETEPLQLSLLGGTETILVAEDEEALQILARDVLEKLGYTVLMAKNGVDAVEMYTAHRDRIDLLLMDVMMPVMGGIEAYKQMRRLGEDTPLIFMTGYSSEIVQNQFIQQNILLEELGAAVIQKPYTVKGLGSKIREALTRCESKNIHPARALA